MNRTYRVGLIYEIVIYNPINSMDFFSLYFLIELNKFKHTNPLHSLQSIIIEFILVISECNYISIHCDHWVVGGSLSVLPSSERYHTYPTI